MKKSNNTKTCVKAKKQASLTATLNKASYDIDDKIDKRKVDMFNDLLLKPVETLRKECDLRKDFIQKKRDELARLKEKKAALIEYRKRYTEMYDWALRMKKESKELLPKSLDELKNKFNIEQNPVCMEL